MEISDQARINRVGEDSPNTRKSTHKGGHPCHSSIPLIGASHTVTDTCGATPGWPAMMGEPQFDYEPPRTVTKCADRAKRLKCLGNAVVPQQAYPFFEAMAIMEMVSSTVRKR